MTEKKRKSKLAPSATPWDIYDESELTPTQLLIKKSHKSAYEFRHEQFAFDTEFFNSFIRDSCPLCGSENIKMFGHEHSGMQRYRCSNCNKTFTPVTGTIFEARKLPISAWADFLVQTLSFESIAVITGENRRSDTTIPYWIAKTFAVLEGVQDSIMLSGNVQIDETYYPIPGKDKVLKDGKYLRGLSRNQICIGVGCDDSGNSYCVREGLGKTSASKTMEAFGSHIMAGSHLIHDMERGHNKLVEELRLDDEVYNSKLLKTLEDRDNPLKEVNHLCYLLKRFLHSHSGFDRGNLDGWLNLFSVAMNPPRNKMKKVEFVLNRAMCSPNTLRFRDFYSKKRRSDAKGD
jgi:transposase-like protein